MKFYVAVLALSCVLSVSVSAQNAARESTLDTVTKSAALRVCTPGDYKPFAFLKPDGSYEGIDVDLTASLAKALGAQPSFVKTTWSNLMADFTSGKCDIAVGGISVTTERLKRASFSNAHMVNGKVPLTRCEDVKRFQTVADIDKAGIKAITNPGGTNEKFAKANFKTATLTIHPENLTIFDELLQKRADVFVTESAEALVQQKLKPGLCAVNPDKPLQYSETGFMLPRDDTAMKAFVDQWLHLAQASGEYAAIKDKWLR